MRNDVKNNLAEALRNVSTVDKVRPLQENDYDRAYDEYLTLIRPDQNNLDAIYQVGSVGVPGISDIDYFLVFKNNQFDNFRRYDINRLSAVSRYTFAHNAWFVDQEIMKNLRLWFPFFDLKFVYGRSFSIDPIDNNQKELWLLLLTQYFLTRIPSDLYYYSIFRNVLYERTMLAMVYSLKHFLTIWQKAGLYCDRTWTRFIDEYTCFRREWFNHKKGLDYLKSYIVDALMLCYALLEHFAQALKSLGIQGPSDSFEVDFGHRVLVFQKEWNPTSALDAMLRRKTKTMTFSVPLELGFYIFLWIQKKESFIAKQISRKTKKLTQSFQIPTALGDSFHEHSDFVEAYQIFNRGKFGIPAKGYHTLWSSFSHNFVIDFLSRIYQRF